MLQVEDFSIHLHLLNCLLHSFVRAYSNSILRQWKGHSVDNTTLKLKIHSNLKQPGIEMQYTIEFKSFCATSECKTIEMTFSFSSSGLVFPFHVSRSQRICVAAWCCLSMENVKYFAPSRDLIYSFAFAVGVCGVYVTLNTQNIRDSHNYVALFCDTKWKLH